MTPKEYLSQLRLTDIQIKQCQMQLDEIETQMIGVRSMDYSADRIQSSPVQDKWSAKMDKVIRIQDKLVTLKGQLIVKRDKIVRQINSLDRPEYVEILFLRYVEYKTLLEISEELNYDYDHLRHLHGRALQAFGRAQKQRTETHIDKC